MGRGVLPDAHRGRGSAHCGVDAYDGLMPSATRKKAAPAPSSGGPATLPFTGDEEANRLNAENPTAMLIGFVLDQQVTVQKAFSGPRVMFERLGTLDPGAIARMDGEELAAAFRRPPAIHRFPGSMAARVQALCAHLAENYSGDASLIWREAADARDLTGRLGRLPGFGEMKVRTVTALLAKQYSVRPEGIDKVLPDWPTLGDVTSAAELEAYQAGKRAYKASMRAQGVEMSAPRRRRTPAAAEVGG